MNKTELLYTSEQT